MEGITKRFGAVVANDGIGLAVPGGTVHALLGENGAGKTTLMNILYGLYQPDEGRIWVRGRPVRIRSPRDAIRLGIGMIHQQFTLVPPLTVVENVVLGLELNRARLDLAGAARRIEELAARYGFAVDPGARAGALSIGAQQRVEIVKALYRGADLLILDEPTSVLAPSEIAGLFAVIRGLVAAGKSVIFISHKLDEVCRISDAVTVLRRGRVVATVPTREATPEALARMMVGQDVVLRLARPPAQEGGPVLQVEDLEVAGDRGEPAVRRVTLEVRGGEILGIAGVDGNGQAELAEAIAGLRAVRHGRIVLDGHDITRRPPAARIAAGLGFIPADRAQGVVADFSVMENLLLKMFAGPPFARHGFLNHRAMADHAARLVERFDIRIRSLAQPVRELSGGNLQKVVLAREVSGQPLVILAVQPTRGLDVGASEYILRQLVDQRGRGAAILHISTELEELLAICDRIAVMFRGEIMGVVDAAGATDEQLGLMMAGTRRPSAGEVA